MPLMKNYEHGNRRNWQMTWNNVISIALGTLEQICAKVNHRIYTYSLEAMCEEYKSLLQQVELNGCQWK